MKRILILGAGAYLMKNISLLKDAGFYCIAADRDVEAPGKDVAHEFAPVDIADPSAVVELARDMNVDGILPLNEFGIRSAAAAGEALGLMSVSVETAEATCDKGFMRDAWAQDKLASPPHRVLTGVDGLFEAVESIGFPCVMKPADSGGSGRGISIIRSREDAIWAFDFAKPHARNGRFVIEGFLEGVEMTVETLSIGGEVHFLAMSDKSKPDLKTRVATSLNYPADMPTTIIDAVKDLVRKALLSLGIINGMGHTEVIVTNDGPMLVETGARGGGGHVYHTCIEAVSGVCAPVETARLLTGENVVLPPIQNRGAVYRFFTPPHGVLRRVDNLEQVKGMEGVLDAEVVVPIGGIVAPLANSLFRAGFVVTTGPDRSTAVALADKAEKMIFFEVDPIEGKSAQLDIGV